MNTYGSSRINSMQGRKNIELLSVSKLVGGKLRTCWSSSPPWSSCPWSWDVKELSGEPGWGEMTTHIMRFLFLGIWPRSYSLKCHLHCCVFRALFHPAVEQDQHKVSPSLKRPQFYIFCLQYELEWLRCFGEIQKLPNDLTSFSLSWAIFTIIGLSLVASNTLSLEVEHLLVLDIFTVLSEIIIHFTCLIWCWWGVQKQSFLEGIRWLWQIQRI